MFDLPAVTCLPGFSACAAGFLAPAVPLKVGVGVGEDLKLLARCSSCRVYVAAWTTVDVLLDAVVLLAPLPLPIVHLDSIKAYPDHYCTGDLMKEGV